MLRGKCALVTGSSGGLGLAMVRALAGAGANVVVHGLAPREEMIGIAAALAQAFTIETEVATADLADLSAIETMMLELGERFGGVDILVNNAVIRHFSPIESFPPDAWDRSIAVNLTAAFHTMRLAVPHMKAAGWGRIINMSSIYGSRGAENRIDYVTTKTALIGMTRAAAIELARTGITCNALCPGTVPSPVIIDRIAAIAAERGQSPAEAQADYLGERHPTGRFISPEAVGEFVRFLCSPAGDDITGAILPIDGGWLAR